MKKEITNNKKKKTWCVYRHTSPSGKVYIGITSRRPKQRWGHGCNYSSCQHFFKAIKKYGWDNIKHEVLFTGLPEKRAKQLEIDLIRHYKNLGISYNITDGGDGIIGVPKTKKWYDAVRRAWLGKHLSDEAKKKISEANKGNQACKGKHWSKESIAKRTETRKKNGVHRRMPLDVLRNIKQHTAKVIPVNQYTLEGEFIATYYSMSEAGRVNNIAPHQISECCNGKHRQAKGFIWRKAI